MLTLLDSQMLLLIALAASGVSFASAVFIFFLMKSISKEHRKVNKEMFGLVKRIEGLTAHRREQVLYQFDKLVESLEHRIPTQVAAKASDSIFETESTILSRLAELEPALSDEVQKEKLDSLIESMESLEKTLVAHTVTAVHQVMLENRRNIFAEDYSQPEIN